MVTVHANPNPKFRAAIPLLLDVQADLLAALDLHFHRDLTLNG
jgi:hypothetical protein